MIPKIVSLEHAGTYAIRVQFADGVKGEIDLAQELDGEIFEPLRDPQLFTQFCLDPDTHTIVWPNGADFDPATLYNWQRGDGAELALRATQWREKHEWLVPESVR